MRIADRLGMSIQECKRKHTSKEFVRWCVYLREEVNWFHREDYFYAMIAFCVARSNAKNPDKVKFDDFLLKFKAAQKNWEEDVDETDEEAAEANAKKSMAFWSGVLGIKIK